MAEPSTFIKLDRSILEWRWFTDANTFRVFVYLLLKANIKDNEFQKITVRRGELVTSYAAIAKALQLSVQNVRTALQHMKDTGEITVSTYPKFQVISVKNYALYQSANSQLTGNQQATNNQLTGNQQQSKKVRKKESKNGRSSSVGTRREHHTAAEVLETVSQLGFVWSEQEAESFIEFNERLGWTHSLVSAATKWEQQRRRHSRKRSPAVPELTAEDADYDSLVNRFREEGGDDGQTA